MTDYCKKLWNERQDEQRAEEKMQSAFDDGMVSGLKWGLIFAIPWTCFCLWALNN